MHFDSKAFGSTVEQDRLGILKITGGAQRDATLFEQRVIDGERHDRMGNRVDHDHIRVLIHNVVNHEDFAKMATG